MKLKQRRLSEVQAQRTGRMIVTTYYETPAKLAIMRVNRSMHAATAVPNAIKHMQRDDYDARVAEVWDEEKNEILITVVGSVGQDNVKITYFYDPITGAKLRPQPHEKRQITEAVFTDRMAKLVEQLSVEFSTKPSVTVIDKAMSKMQVLREQVE